MSHIDQQKDLFSRSSAIAKGITQRVNDFTVVYVAIAYALATVVYTWPLVTLGNSAIPANIIGELDGWQTTWHLWWTARAISQGQNPYYTDMLFYPDGVALFWQTLNAPLGVLMSPITLLFGPVAGYNSALFLSFVLGALFTYLLVNHLTNHKIAASFAGAIFAFAPFHFNRMLDGSLEHATIQWIPLYIYLLLLAKDTGRAWQFISAAFCFLLVALTSWYYGVYTAIFSALLALCILIAQGLRPFLHIFVVGLLICLIMFPIVQLNLFVAANDNNIAYRQSLHSADLLDFFMPSPLHPILGHPWGWLIHDFIGDWNVTLGWSVIGLAVIGLRAYWRNCWWWLVLLFCTMSLVLGPVLRLGGHDTGIAMPYTLLNLLPGLRVGQRPVYMITFAMLALSVLAAYGIKALWRTPAGHYLAISCLLFTAFEFYPGILPTNQPQVHPFFQSLRDQPKEALLEIPDLWWASAGMRDQMFHQWPITGGYIARRDGIYLFRDQTPGVRQLLLDERFLEDILQPSEEAQTLAALDASGIRYVVMRHQIVADDQFQRLQRRLERIFKGQSPIIDDNRLLVYQVPAQEQAPSTLLALGNGWYEPEQDGNRRWRWINGQGEVFLTNTGSSARMVQLRLQMSAFQSARRVDVTLDGQPLETIDVPFEPLHYELQLVLAPGRHTLTLSGLNPTRDSDGRQLSIVVTQIEVLSEK